MATVVSGEVPHSVAGGGAGAAVRQARAEQTAPPPTPAGGARARLLYLDYLRAALIALVILHHAAITYGGGAAGGWYYSDRGPALLPQAILNLFVSFNQAYFMGFLFLLSGYFSIPSYLRRGAGPYAADRLRRLGIPLAVGVLVISPLATWLAAAARPGPALSMVGVLERSLHTFGPGPLWFVEALLIMDLLFVAWARWMARIDLRARPGGPFPGRWTLGAFAVALGLASFLVRLEMPVGATFLALNIAYFPGYVAMFVLGIAAWRLRWLDRIPDWAGRWALQAVAACVVLLLLTVPAHLRAHAGSPAAVPAFSGGLSWKAVIEPIWEAWVLVGMSLLLLRWGQRRLNRPSRTWQGWADASYTAYIIQPLILVPASIALQGAAWPVLAKFAVVGPLAVVATYAAARLLRLVPAARRVVG